MKKKKLILLFSFLLGGCSSKPLSTYDGILMTGGMAIGGETTGVRLKRDNGDLVELKVPAHFSLKKFKNRRVEVVGVMTDIRGTEILKRKVLEVEKIDLLPMK